MMRHPFIAVLLALIVAWGSVLSGAAMARTGGTSVELCQDGTTVTVTLDDRGRPAAAHRPCPMCLAAQDLALPPAPAGWTRQQPRAVAAHIPRPAWPTYATLLIPPAARGPPLPV